MNLVIWTKSGPNPNPTTPTDISVPDDDEGGEVGVRGGTGDIFGLAGFFSQFHCHEIEKCQNLNVDIS